MWSFLNVSTNWDPMYPLQLLMKMVYWYGCEEGSVSSIAYSGGGLIGLGDWGYSICITYDNNYSLIMGSDTY